MPLFFTIFQNMNSPGKLLKYSASAGSGKTHALTAFYLSRVLLDPGAYRRILAVTFTNSAAAEMKSRILQRLSLLGEESPEGESERSAFAVYLCTFFPEMWPDPDDARVTVRKNAPLALNNILQDYSRFTVGTIDSFFQRVIRAFAREMDIPSGYEIELEHNNLLSDAVDGLLAEVATDNRLLGWISSYVGSRLDDNKGWDIRREIMEVAELIFKEDFRQLGQEEKQTIGDYEVLKRYADRIYTIKRGFETELKALAETGVAICSECGLTPDDFLNKRRGGVGDALLKYAAGETKPPNATWHKAAEEGKLFPGSAAPEVIAAFAAAVQKGLDETVRAISSLFEQRHPLYLSAMAQVRTIHIIGILGAISERVRSLAHDENLFLLSDSGELINRLIEDDDTPFIYEKIGTAYDHYIIDEFQDTSRIQWNNFRPLMSETMSRGMDNLVVGDVKQSIYRWRNSDWRIIHSEASAAFGEESVQNILLDTNYRSRDSIIRFNNHLFAPGAIPALCDERLSYDQLKLSDIYEGSVQKGTPDKSGGVVQVSLYGASEDEKWKERVLNDLPALVERMQDHGYRADDILFLCRTNEEGKSIISRLLEYSAASSAERRSKYNFEVTSGDSLFLESNPAVTLIIASLRYLADPGSRINRSLMVRSFVLATGGDEHMLYAGDRKPDRTDHPVHDVERDRSRDDHPVQSVVKEEGSDAHPLHTGKGEGASGEALLTPGAREEDPDDPMPAGWEEALNAFRNESLFSATENMIRFFGLGSRRENVAYLCSLQDVVLTYSGRYSSDLSSFVAWWDREGCRSTLSQSDRQEAMRVMTIHKAKGLQGKVVIVPFVSWSFGRRGFSRPLLWVTDVPEPFSPMPFVLPEQSSRLDDSLFAGEAMTEKVSEWIDGINLLYVAFTRAVDVLCIMAPETAKPSSSGGASAESLLNEAVKSLPDDFTRSETDNVVQITCGELPPVTTEAKEVTWDLDSYEVNERRGRLRLRTGGALPLDEVKMTERGGRAYGIMMHELLSRVTTAGDIGTAADYVCDSGLLPLSRREETVARVRAMISSERVRHWFDGSCTVMTEATILLPTGGARRPDRIMTADGNVSVLDYKFGEPDERHRRQAASYRDLLQQMGYAKVNAWLWYVEKDILEEV